jgi:PAS domain S-box-containing protein
MDTIRSSLKGLRILIVEDEALIAEVVSDRLIRAGCQVVGTADSGRAAIELATRLRPDMILMDVRLQGPTDGIETAATILQKLPVAIVYLTAHSDQETLQRAKATSGVGYVLKPIHFESLLATIEVAQHRFRMEQRLEERQLTHTAILGSISDAVITADVSGAVQFMNAAAEQLTGWTLDGCQGTSASEVLRIVDRAGTPRKNSIAARALETRTNVTFERGDHLVSRSGRKSPIEGGAAPVIDALGRLVGATVTLRDVSSVRRIESDLRTVAGRLQTVVDTAVDGVLLVDQLGTIVMFNPACVRLFGYAAEEAIGRRIDMLMPSPLAEGRGERVGKGPPENSAPLSFSARPVQARRKDGTTFAAELSLGEAPNDGNPLFVGVVHDTTERRALEAALLDAIGHEQRRLGRDLHDGLGQELVALSLLMAALARNADRARLAIAPDLERAVGVVKHAIRSARGVARGLSPIDGEHGGLIVGLRDLVARLSDLPGPKIRFSAIEAAHLGLTPATTDHLYRIAQEALTNALRHARANSIDVTLDIEPTTVRLKVCDDGNGGPPTDQNGSGLGLRTMRYRAALIGARFKIAPGSPAGTCIVCECPQAA